MKQINFLLGLLLIFNVALNAQVDTITQRLVLIGDAGQLNADKLIGSWHPVVNAVKNNITLDKKTTVLFLGDNLYKNGLPDRSYANYEAARAVLDTQFSLAENKLIEVLMIPGNHDWENGSPGGYDAIVREQNYVDFLFKKNANFWPKDGCPGPKGIPLGNDVFLILFDSQWWLHPFDKPEIESDCDCKTKDELVSQIADLAARNSNKLIILASHHPFKSNGIHGGFFKLKQHLFPLTELRQNLYIPLPVIGSIYPIARGVFGTPQDLKHPVYQEMITKISEAIKKAAPNVVFVSGHDHSLQHLQYEGYNYIVSGGGCKQNRSSKSPSSRFSNNSEGFAVMEFSNNKNVYLSIYTVKGPKVVKAYTDTLLNFKTITTTAIDTATSVTIEDPTLKYKDTISVPASDEFKPVKGFKKLFMGENYRSEWSTPVNMKVLSLRKEKGGLTIVSLGGGTQTKSLRLKDKSGKEWTLRSLNKNPINTIPENFRNNLAEKMISELTSASHPYGAMAIPEMAKALDIPVAKPELFFVPDDPALGLYRSLFRNNVCTLEEQNASTDGSDTKTTAKLFDKILEENDHRPLQHFILKARLLDIVVADYDRHFDQWRWGTSDTGKGKIYYPIPRDRDQVFFNSDGLLMKLISKNSMPFLKGFRSNIQKVNWLGYSARDFDRLFLADLDAGEWENTIKDFQQRLSDSVIRTAVQKLPAEIFAFNGEKTINKLISRRNLLTKDALTYYKFISRQVNILGSNQKEYFAVSNKGEGLEVKVYARAKGNDTSFIMYDRIFDPSVTKEIRLYGLNDDDFFDVEESANSRIKLRIIGGKGIDTFNIRGNLNTLLYDLNADSNIVINKNHSKNRFSNDPPVNESNILGFNYNTIRYPKLEIGYNGDDGLLLGAGISKRTYGFRNLPYATEQTISALYAPSRKAYQVKYAGVINHITRKYDLTLNALYASPSLKNFFGLGNNTKINKSNDYTYYQSRYKTLELEALLRKRFYDKFYISFGPTFYQYKNSYKDNAAFVLGKPQQLGLDSARIFSNKSYLGGKLVLLLDNRTNEIFPKRGMYWRTEIFSMAGLSKGSKFYTGYTSDMTLYASLNDPANFITILKFGGGRIYSKNYEFFQALSFGMNNDLNGFRKNRYAGTSTLYGGIEFRIKLVDINSYILPGALGISTFYNVGRVWLKDENSNKWHGAFGGGLYYVPFNKFIISASAGFSKDEKAFNFTLGTKFNLTY
jgi:hypothetical protein